MSIDCAARNRIAAAMQTATAPRRASAYAPSNIALSKYWGKRDQARNLPLNSSLSISLAEWGSHTEIVPAEDGADRVWLNGAALDAETPFAAKALRFADLFRAGRDAPLHIRTRNTIPTAAGLASSASGFAALTRALVSAFGLELSERDMSLIARLGSGSAARSLWHGFVRWDRGTAPDGGDSLAAPLDVHWPAFRIAIVAVDTGPKSMTSRDGMNHTVATSPLFATWPQTAEADCAAIETAVRAQDLPKLGALAEANALAMHATMLAARPALSYLKPESWAVLERLWRARAEGLQAFATMDAGANVKLIFEQTDSADVLAAFPQAEIIAPFSVQN
ncbi:diphosphomevalonate decarboxylase [Poseidonocella sedimentorum]|uniref:diphosphomevalonate decarboxylase n=1 Tax=Poseidonocella sedimentorum TaxID=871652 RepID=A0A1I6ERN6_9RHOB|nr:diphosphomevalonate decarboxylase [Poseidonocella sedimentorum]SFR20201.1 diphosphomevalonate decarboxylase [Poseidonocella sedimentorum]